MTDKQIIIDGVDVSGCKHFKNATCIADYLLTDMNFSEAKCELCKNCYYKQLKRKEQECEELKEKQKELLHDCNSCKFHQYRQALDKIEDIADDYNRVEKTSQYYRDGFDEIQNIINKVRGIKMLKDRFKFRYNYNNKIYDVFAIDFFHSTGQIVSLDRKETLMCKLDLNNLIQCTGLKDKNDKLIYEGDILDLYISSKKLYRYKVKYEIGSFMLVSDDEIFNFPNIWNANMYPLSQLYYEYQNEENIINECEIIGNIYENPELLQECD